MVRGREQPGEQIKRTGENGHGVNYVLMIRLTSICEEEKRLKQERNKGSLEAQQIVSGGVVPEYLPEGQEEVVERRIR